MSLNFRDYFAPAGTTCEHCGTTEHVVTITDSRHVFSVGPYVLKRITNRSNLCVSCAIEDSKDE